VGRIETGIKDTLLADSSVTAILGTRLRPMAAGAPEVKPYATYQVTDRKTDAALDGTIADYRTIEFELGIYGDSFNSVMDASDACRDRLDQFGGTTSGVEFAPCEFESETDVEEVTTDGQELPVYVRVQTYKALYRIVS
jgi:hypothetical protein